MLQAIFMPMASVIVAFYNRIDYLKLVLAGFERQTSNDFEIVIADDGSKPEVVDELELLMKNSPLSINHVWHEDLGFRKNKIMNEAIVASTGEYIIIIDGDCVPHREFVREHVHCCEPNTCFTGRRVNLSEKMTRLLTPERVREAYLEKHFFRLIIDGLAGKTVDVEKGLYLRSKFLRDLANRKKRGLVGCNFSLHRRDLMAVNGFDERYTLPSVGEDTDIQFRLEKNGVIIKSLNQIAIQYHLYHPLQDRPQVNLDLYRQVVQEGKAFTDFGIVKRSINN
jgi:glycosyltransferase involved in cell wall biosynthesis